MLLNYVIWTVLAHLQRTWPIKYDGFYPLYTVQKIKMVRSFLDIPYIHTFLWEYAAWVVYSFYYPHILYGFLEKWKWKMLCEPFSWSSMWNYQGWLSENRSESIYFTVEMTIDKSKRWPWGLERIFRLYSRRILPQWQPLSCFTTSLDLI